MDKVQNLQNREIQQQKLMAIHPLLDVPSYLKSGLSARKSFAAGILLLFPLLLGCVGPGDISAWVFGDWNSDNEDMDDGTFAHQKRMVVYDADNNQLGLTDNAFMVPVLIIKSDKGYFYRLNQDAAILMPLSRPFYYTDVGGQGTAFLTFSDQHQINGREVYSNPVEKKLYSYARVAKDIAVSNTSIKTYRSVSGDTRFFDTPLNLIETGKSAYVLREISKEEAGIPETIRGPLSMRYE